MGRKVNVVNFVHLKKRSKRSEGRTPNRRPILRNPRVLRQEPAWPDVAKNLTRLGLLSGRCWNRVPLVRWQRFRASCERSQGMV